MHRTHHSTSTHRAILTSGVWVRRIQAAEGFGPLRGFSCGKGKMETKVNAMITGRFEGRGPVAKWLVMETGIGKLVGVCGYVRQPLTYDVLPTPRSNVLNTTITIPNAAYIHVIAIKEEYRGLNLPDGTRIGSYLLNHVQGYIRREFGDGAWTWAYVDDDNRSSHTLFTVHGFGQISPQTPGEDWKRVWSPTQRFEEFSGATPPWERNPLVLV